MLLLSIADSDMQVFLGWYGIGLTLYAWAKF